MAEATQPNSQSTTLFSAISVMVGFLLALNAMLLTVPERRRFIADLRMQGFDSRQVLLLLGSQALALGLGASLVGFALGEVLSHTLLHQVPAYLTFAFPISGHLVVRASTVAFALGCGLLAALLASLPPVLDLRPGRPPDAIFREVGGGSHGSGTPLRVAGGRRARVGCGRDRARPAVSRPHHRGRRAAGGCDALPDPALLRGDRARVLPC